MSVILHPGDCLDILPTLQANSIDAVLCDPPYHLTQLSRNGSPRQNDPNTPFGRTKLGSKGFLGKTWDGGDIAFRPKVWSEVLRVLKPGGHLLAFGGTRTYHRMVCAIEDAGFEIKDQIAYLYGTGFPKSVNIAQNIDKASRGVPQGGVDPTSPNHGRYKGGSNMGAGPGSFMAEAGEKVDRILSDEALPYVGWGTALKPSIEPIVVCRKPLIGTVAQNVLMHGTGGLNIDACRIPTNPDVDDPRLGGKGTWSTENMAKNVYGDFAGTTVGSSELGRWPANTLHDGSDEVLAAFAQFGAKTSGKPGIRRKPHTTNSMAGPLGMTGEIEVGFGDSGSAARFFQSCPFNQNDYKRFYYSAKASKADRAGSKHPTVKPVSLMRYLVRLITPIGGVVLDPFAGTGTTGEAAILEGCHAVLIEREDEYVADIRRRLALWLE